MKLFSTKAIASALLVTLLASAAYADTRPSRQSPEARIATVPGLTQTQRDDIVRIEMETREAQRALMDRVRNERKILREEQNSKLRAALGDTAYANYVSWKLEQRAEHRGARRSHGKGYRSAPSGAEQGMEPATGE
ncbi:MAG TPA: hypothetical protein VFN25_07150 [Dokdonella sp.]|uniref:hypothetical protein n=1 Tax=Dokdonella sp. TaxID=2291710 RepID=UPI002D8067D8|nr:hypothetical protein [Dokdonella sp.]HET9032666.1 hypothetical protein [Dokdonella sp.]